MLGVAGCVAGVPGSGPEETTVQGRIELVAIDHTGPEATFVGEQDELESHFVEETVAYIHTDDGAMLELELMDGTAPSFLEPGDRVVVSGSLAGTKIQCGTRDDVDVVDKPLTQAAAGLNTTRKVAVILFNFQNDTEQPLTAEYAKERMFTAETSVNAFMKEASFNQLKLAGIVDTTGDVFGWYTIADDNSGCDTTNWRNLATAAATKDGKNLSGYNHLVFVFPSNTTCSWAGLASVGGSWGFVKSGYMHGKTAAHELGHNLGLSHGSSYTCTDASGARVPLSATCTTSEYGDLFDTMGSSYRHFSAYQKTRLGWMGTSNIKTLNTDGTHYVDLAPLGATTSATQVLRVHRRNSSDYYYVEYREPTPEFDDFASTLPVVNGLSIRIAPEPTTRKAPLLLDMNPSTTTFNDAALLDGATFVDLGNKVSIEMTSRTTAKARVKVVIGPTVTQPAPDTTAPTVTITAPATGSTIAGFVALTASASDSAGVTKVEFRVDGSLVGTDTMSPFTDTWDSKRVANGAHTISARAYDAAGNVTSATDVAVTVDNIGVTELVENGGFEGALTPWTKTGNAYHTTASSYPHTGEGYAYLGAAANAVGTLTQTITIPAGATRSLRYYLNITSNETSITTSYDRLYVEVRSTTGTLLRTLKSYNNLNATYAGNYQEYAHSLADFAGQTVVLQFRVAANSTNTTWFRIDDVTTL